MCSFVEASSRRRLNGRHSLRTEQKAVLTGNPHAWEGNTEVWGEEMVFLLAEGNMIVTGGTQRVRVQLVPSNEGPKLPNARSRRDEGDR